MTSKPEELFQLLHGTSFVTKLHIPGGSSPSPFKEALGVGKQAFARPLPGHTGAAVGRAHPQTKASLPRWRAGSGRPPASPRRPCAHPSSFGLSRGDPLLAARQGCQLIPEAYPAPKKPHGPVPSAESEVSGSIFIMSSVAEASRGG